MFVNLANAYKKLNKESQASSVLEELDWSAVSGIFQICLASLKDDVGTVCKLLPTLAAAGELTKGQFREWPVFDWVRKHDDVVMTFGRVFGEPIQSESVESGSVEPDTLSSSPPGETEH